MNMHYYMAESVFAMRLVNFRSVTFYTDQDFKENAHFGALNLFTSGKKGWKKVTRRLSTLRTCLDFDFVLQLLKLCLYVNERDDETNS